MLIGSAIAVGRRIKRREDFRGGLRSWLGVARIELRHSPGWLALPVLVVLAEALLGGMTRGPVLIWAETSAEAHRMLALAGPVTAGLAAWAASRERRRGIEDLLATTPCPEFQRRLAALAATAAASVLCFALTVGAMFSVTAVRAAWGGPAAWPLVVAVVAIVAQATLGYAAGARLPSRFTAPLVAVGLFAAQIFMESGPNGDWSHSWQSYLSPATDYAYSSAWIGVQPVEVMPWQVLLVAGLGVVAVAAISFGKTRTLASSLTLSLGLALAVSGVVGVFQTAPDVQQPRGTYNTLLTEGEPLNGYETRPAGMVCNDADIPVCVHPAYEPLLPRLADSVAPMTDTLAGVPGVPERVGQVPSGSYTPPGIPRAGTAGFVLDDVRSDITVETEISTATSAVAVGLVRDQDQANLAGAAYGEAGENAAQKAVRESLMPYADLTGCDETRGCQAAADRFSELDRDEQRAWLRENYRDLRAGELRLRDMP